MTLPVKDLDPRTLPLSDEDPETELLTAANTTLANDIPDVDPRKRGSLAPWTETMPIFDTSFVSFSRSYFSLSSLEVGGFAEPLRCCAVPPAAEAGLFAEPPGWKLGLKSSAGAKAMEFSWSSDSR